MPVSRLGVFLGGDGMTYRLCVAGGVFGGSGAFSGGDGLTSQLAAAAGTFGGAGAFSGYVAWPWAGTGNLRVPVDRDH